MAGPEKWNINYKGEFAGSPGEQEDGLVGRTPNEEGVVEPSKPGDIEPKDIDPNEDLRNRKNG